MAIIVNLDVMMTKRKMSLNELSEKVDLTLSNLSILKTGKAKAIRFSTLEEPSVKHRIVNQQIY
jgi:putative transcriptional regulator